MALERDHNTPGFVYKDLYWRFTSWQVTDAPQSDADRAVIATLAAYESRKRSKTSGSAPVPESAQQVMFVEKNPANTESGSRECVVRDGGSEYAIDPVDFDPDTWTKGRGYAILRHYHSAWKSGAKDVLEPGQQADTLPSQE